jgi:hypothetical protein
MEKKTKNQKLLFIYNILVVCYRDLERRIETF